MEITFYMPICAAANSASNQPPSVTTHTHNTHTESRSLCQILLVQLQTTSSSSTFRFSGHFSWSPSSPWSQQIGLFSLSLFFQSIWFVLGSCSMPSSSLGSPVQARLCSSPQSGLSVNLTSGDSTLYQRNTKSRLIAEDRFQDQTGLYRAVALGNSDGSNPSSDEENDSAKIFRDFFSLDLRVNKSAVLEGNI